MIAGKETRETRLEARASVWLLVSDKFESARGAKIADPVWCRALNFAFLTDSSGAPRLPGGSPLSESILSLTRTEISP